MDNKITIEIEQLEAWKAYAGTSITPYELRGKEIMRGSVKIGDQVTLVESPNFDPNNKYESEAVLGKFLNYISVIIQNGFHKADR